MISSAWVEELLAQAASDIPADAWYLSVYTTSQHYGGPEEGGWWYSLLDFHGSRHFATRQSADAALECLQGWLEQRNAGEQVQRSSATASMPDGPDPYLDTEGYIPRDWTDGDRTILVVERRPGMEAEGQTVPHYE